MARWFSKRWVWAALAGAGLTVGMVAGRADGESPPKVGSVMTLNPDGKGDHQYKVIKTEKLEDGSYLSELKDTRTGATLNYLSQADGPPGGASNPALPKAKSRTNDPLLPPLTATMPDPPKEKDKHPLLHRIFGKRDQDKTPNTMPNTTSSGASMSADPAADSGKKPGIITRIFGPKKPAGPSMPSMSTAPSNVKQSSPNPPPIIPFPSSGLTGNTPSTPPPQSTPNKTSTPSFFPNTAPEPPRVMPSIKPAPVMPPMPSVAAPVMPPTAPAFPKTNPRAVPSTPPPPPVTTPTPPPPVAPAVPALPKPAPIPQVPAPVVPTPPATTAPPVAPTPAPIPAPPSVPAPGGEFPPIPIPPGGTSSTRPIQVIVPTGYIPAQVAFDRDVQPWVIALQTMNAPSARLTAAKALADCRHRSSDGVKNVLFQAARMDPCGEVRAACITHLCELGYFQPFFLGYIQVACDDTDPMVRDAAKAACEKMIRK